MSTATTTATEVADLQRMLADGEPVTLLDIRPLVEREEWHIPGSLHLDVYQALKAGDQTALASIDLDPSVPVVTLCAAGKASEIAAEQLRARRFDARSLAGGMKAWSLAWNTADIAIPGGSATVVQIRRTGKGCLSYLIGSGGDAVVIDASLGPDVYLELARERGWTITSVLDTHVHADHLSRGRALAEAADARLHLPATGRLGFRFESLRDGDIIVFGSSRLTAIATPGHTNESSSYLLDGAALFTGDTLFLSGVGRPDLEASAGGARERARLLWSSLRRLTALPGTTQLLPGHTSSPVAFDSVPLVSSLGEVKHQVAMLELTEDDFVETILARLPPTPPNHAAIIALNEAGELPEGDPTELEAGANRCAIS